MSQSRQAWIGLVIAAIVILLRRGGQSKLLVGARSAGCLARGVDGARTARFAEPAQFDVPTARMVPRGVCLLEALADPRAWAAILVRRPDAAVPTAAGRARSRRLGRPRRACRVSSTSGWGFIVVLSRVDQGCMARSPSRPVLSRVSSPGAVRPVLGWRPDLGTVRHRRICLGALALHRSVDASDATDAEVAPPAAPRGLSSPLPYDRAVGRPVDGR